MITPSKSLIPIRKITTSNGKSGGSDEDRVGFRTSSTATLIHYSGTTTFTLNGPQKRVYLPIIFSTGDETGSVDGLVADGDFADDFAFEGADYGFVSYVLGGG